MRRKSFAALRTTSFPAIAFMLATVVPAHGQQLMVHPTRLTFEGSVRSAQVQLFNRGSADATYRISVIRMRMDEKGGMQRVTEPIAGENFADELIRFSPRQVVIPPGGAQIVRVQLRKPAELPSGEYRSHLLFQALPAAAEIAKPPEDRGFQVTLRPIVSVSIPLIVLQGATTSSVTIGNGVLHPATSGSAQTISFELQRGGSRSTYGDLTVSRKKGRSAETTIAQMKGVALYTPNVRRLFRLPVTGPTDGEISISFRETRNKGEGASARITLENPR